MTSEQLKEIRLAALNLQRALNDDPDTQYQIEQRIHTSQAIEQERPTYRHEIRIIAASEAQVFP